MSLIALCADIFLIIMKYYLAVINNSAVLMADAYHSFGDMGVTLTVLMSVIINEKYRERRWIRSIEGFISMLIAVFLITGSVGILIDVYNNTTELLRVKTGIPLVAAILGTGIACAVSFFMSRYKRTTGEKYGSIAFVSEGMHTASDFYTSLGVWVTLLLGYFGLHIERLTAFIVAFMIMRIGFQVFKKALDFFGFAPSLRAPAAMLQRITALFPEKTMLLIRGPFRLIMKVVTGWRNYFREKFFLPEEWILNNFRKLILAHLVLLALLYGGTGFYTVSPWQNGIEMTLGVVTEITEPGLHYNIPPPLGNRTVLNTKSDTVLEHGFRFTGKNNIDTAPVIRWEYRHKDGRIEKNEKESLLVTGDENLVDINFICYYRITEPVRFALECADSHEILRSLFSHEIQMLISRYRLEDIVTLSRKKIQKELKNNLKKSVGTLPIGVTITGAYMLEAPPHRCSTQIPRRRLCTGEERGDYPAGTGLRKQ